MSIRKSITLGAGLLLAAACIVIAYLFLIKQNDRRYMKSIDKNGYDGAGIVYENVYRNGRLGRPYAKIRYSYKGKHYTSSDRNASFNYSLGDSVKIKIDSTNPGRAYIIGTNTK